MHTTMDARFEVTIRAGALIGYKAQTNVEIQAPPVQQDDYDDTDTAVDIPSDL